ncbi:MAG TPA: hypothetical protein VFV28_06495, partial [Limnobacter sp.]|nr:hypothetical protein [Limnobacter sp.]
LAATGQLTGLFGVEELVNADEPTRREVLFYREQSSTGAESEGCPASLINLEDFELPSLGYDETLKSVDAEPKLAPIELAQLGKPQLPTESAALIDPAEVSKNLIQKTRAWLAAWQSKDVNAYLSFYASHFKPEEGSHSDWVASRRDRISKAQELRISISDIQVIPGFDKPDEYDLSFIQDYRAASYQERSRKILTWKSVKGEWLIIREQNLPVNTALKPVEHNQPTLEKIASR